MFKFCAPFKPDAQALLDNIARKGTPRRVHNVELFLDAEIQTEICSRFDLDAGLKKDAPDFPYRRQIALARFLGYDTIHVGLPMAMPLNWDSTAQDGGELPREAGRKFVNEHAGPVTTWEQFEKYPWPDVQAASSEALDWYEKNLPDDMCIVGAADAHFCEYLCWLMGYETLCYALYDQRDLVKAIYEKTLSQSLAVCKRLAGYKRIKAVWGSDDMGFKTGTLISPPDMREFVLAGHKRIVEIAHSHGWQYWLHACGKLEEIMPDLLDDVHIDAKHSFEDTIEQVADAKAKYGKKVAFFGGLDVDFLCHADEAAVRQRVRKTLEACQPGGGYCLGTGNSVANYIPVDSYLAMLDEGRKFTL